MRNFCEPLDKPLEQRPKFLILSTRSTWKKRRNTIIFIFPSYAVAFPRGLTSSLLTVALSVANISLPNKGRSFINLSSLTAAPLTDKHCDMSYCSRCRGHSNRSLRIRSTHVKLSLRSRNVRHISFRRSLFSSIFSFRWGRIYALDIKNLKIWDLKCFRRKGNDMQTRKAQDAPNIHLSCTFNRCLRFSQQNKLHNESEKRVQMQRNGYSRI